MLGEAEIVALTNALEDCTLPLDQFHHRQHLIVASYYAATLPPRQALDRMRSAIRRYAAFHGKSERYHETVTRFWLAMVYTHQAATPSALANEVVEACAAMRLIDRHYSKACLDSAAAKAGWVAPDLEPLPAKAQAVLKEFL